MYPGPQSLKMLYLLFFLICFLGIIFHKSRAVSTIVVSYVFIVMALNFQNPDTHSYILIYEHPATAQEEFGFRMLCSIFNKLGFSYDAFHFIVVTIGLLFLLAGAIKISGKFNRHIGYIMALYMLCPMMNDVVLLRSFLAGCIVIFAISYLVKKERGKFVAYILVASTIHISALLYLLFLISDRHKFNKRIKWLIVIITVALYVMLETSFFQSLLISMGVNAKKVMLRLDMETVTAKEYLLSILFHLCNYASFVFVQNFTKKRCLIKSDDFLRMETALSDINSVLLINIILTAISDQFMRVLWIGMIINSIYYAYVLFCHKKIIDRIVVKLVSLIMPTLMFIYRMFKYTTLDGANYFEYLFKAIIDNNLLLK